MLVLSRQRDETIMIGDDIEITVVDIRGDKVRLGITAPSRVAVHRKEVYEAIKRENEQAARLAGASDFAGIRPSVRPGASAAQTRNRTSSLTSGSAGSPGSQAPPGPIPLTPPGAAPPAGASPPSSIKLRGAQGA